MPTRNEINFIRMWRECADQGHLDPLVGIRWCRAHDARSVQLDADHAGLLEFVAHEGPELTDIERLAGKHQHLGYRILTPLGADLITTADAIGFDPATALADDEPRPELVAPACATCDDTGEVEVLGAFKNPCKACAKPSSSPALYGSREDIAERVKAREYAAEVLTWADPGRLFSDAEVMKMIRDSGNEG